MSAFSKLEGLIDSLLGITRASTPTGALLKNTGAATGALLDYPCKAVILMPYNTGTSTAPTWNYGSVFLTGTSVSGNLIWISAPTTIPCTNANQISVNGGYLSYIILT